MLVIRSGVGVVRMHTRVLRMVMEMRIGGRLLMGLQSARHHVLTRVADVGCGAEHSRDHERKRHQARKEPGETWIMSANSHRHHSRLRRLTYGSSSGQKQGFGCRRLL
jgi:hypothetical protein